MTQLQILVTLGIEPHPIDITQGEMKLRFTASWNVDGVPQPTTAKDAAIVASALDRASQLALQAAPYDPPKILTP